MVAMIIVGGLIVIASVVSLFVSVFLAIRYVKFNRKKNSCHMTGQEIARKLLDAQGLQNIRVKSSESIMLASSYSDFFKKVRLRRLTWKKDSVTSLAMASQKSALAVLDKEKDPDMVQRIRLTPLIYFGPLACVPLILVGLFLDLFVFQTGGLCAIIAIGVSIAFYALSFIMSLFILKTERRAQERAIELVKETNLATDEEIDDMSELFKLYNIQYVNDMILALLELIFRILQIVAAVQSNSGSFSNSGN